MVRLIDQDGTQLGVKSIDEAIRIAQDRGQDLVEVAPGANPPVCKVLDFSKYRYQREKERKEAKKHQKGGHVKEIRFRPKISPHDLDTKIRAMQKCASASSSTAARWNTPIWARNSWNGSRKISSTFPRRKPIPR
jgi:translation initiation factor IF-3